MKRMNRIIKIAAQLQGMQLTPDQGRFTKNSLDEIAKLTGTRDIELISKKSDISKYEEYYELYLDNPAKETRFRSPNFITGVKAYKQIGGKTFLIWRDHEVADFFIVAPKGSMRLLKNDGNNRLNIIASESTLPTLDEFLKSPQKSSYLNYPGFDSFYARKGPYYINDKKYDKVFQIANIEATVKGAGTFTRLIAELKKKNMPILVESIQNPRLPAKLEELGFKRLKSKEDVNYFWEK